MDNLKNLKNKIYLAGDWKEPPLKLAARLEKCGWIIVQKWWEPADRLEAWANRKLLLEKVTEADIFIIDLRSSRAETHAFGGCHLGAGIALTLGKRIFALGNKKTSLLADFVLSDDVALLMVLELYKKEQKFYD